VAASGASRARADGVERGLLSPTAVAGRPPAPHTIAERMAFHGVPSVSIAVIDSGRVAWARAYGVTTPGGAPATPATLFQAASLSKAVAAVTALRLVARGDLALDDDVTARLTSRALPIADSARGAPVTLAGLLSHTAGVTVSGFPGYAAGAPVPTLRQVLDGAPPANTAPVRVDARPGSAWRYSGGGYTVVQQLVEDATGRPYAEAARREALAPFGMRASTFEQPLQAARGADPGRAAAGHRGGGATVPGGWHAYPELAAAGLWTTPADLARLVLGVQVSLRGEPAPCCRRRSPAGWSRPYRRPGRCAMASGSRCSAPAPTPRTSRTPATTRATARSWWGFVNSGRGAVVMTNGEAGVDLAYELLRAVAREYGWPGFRQRMRPLVAAAPDSLRHLAGRYRLTVGADTSVIAVRAEGDRLAAALPGVSAPLAFLPTTDGRFFSTDSGVELAFVRRADGAVTALRILGAGGLPLAERLP
jgi:CubicO group peptidase (beta-lactamase class C family)